MKKNTLIPCSIEVRVNTENIEEEKQKKLGNCAIKNKTSNFLSLMYSTVLKECRKIPFVAFS